MPAWRWSGCSRRCRRTSRERGTQGGAAEPGIAMSGAARRVLVIGSGIAGLTAALDLAERRHVRVTLVTKGALGDSSTAVAQGGLAAVTADGEAAGDSVAGHVADTLAAGAGLSEEDAVRVLCGAGRDAVATLRARGVRFDLERGRLARGLEAAHSHERVMHAGGDATGAAISAALLDRLAGSGVEVREGATVLELLVDRGRAVGALLLSGESVAAEQQRAGGGGQLYARTTNPSSATADGVALALRAGAVVADLEFQQFHPTALAVPGHPLVSEAVRGAGAVLLDADGRRFLADAHPAAELAPRDLVARAAAAQMARQRGAPVLLDATALAPSAECARFLAERFPTIDATVRAAGFDWSRAPIPVAPAAHYAMGGVRTDLWGRTSVPGLFAVGEAACTGAHGANRLASNSLLEGAVLGRRAAAAIAEPTRAGAPEPFAPALWGDPIELEPSGGERLFERVELQRLMWDAAGLVRDGEGLARADAVLASWRSPAVTDAASAETANLLLVARALAASARARRESRGAHWRSDFPQSDPTMAAHSAVRLPADARQTALDPAQELTHA